MRKSRSALPERALKTMPPARRVAYLTLEQCRARDDMPGVPLQAALDQALRAARLGPLDAALATNLAYGLPRFRERLEWLLNRFLKRPDRIIPAHKDILRLAAYELIFLDAVPAYASLNWAVETSKAAFGPTLGALTNAVLRKVAALGKKPAIMRFSHLKSKILTSCIPSGTASRPGSSTTSAAVILNLRPAPTLKPLRPRRSWACA